MLLLGQAGVPFTTGFLAKFGVVGASVATHAYVLAAVAMVSAAVAAFFYLRVAVTMYSPVGAVGDAVDDGGADTGRGRGRAPPQRNGAPARRPSGAPASGDGADRVTVQPAGPHRCATRRVGDRHGEWCRCPADRGGHRPVGGLHRGVRDHPRPILDFAHQATLLFT